MRITSKIWLHTLGVLIVLGLCSFQAQAQEKAKTAKAGSNVTVTGCLQKGDEAGEFSITGADGKTYGLRSKSVKLDDHLGHKVTVTGKLKAEEKEEKNENTKEVGDLNVTNLKMVSTSCP